MSSTEEFHREDASLICNTSTLKTFLVRYMKCWWLPPDNYSTILSPPYSLQVHPHDCSGYQRCKHTSRVTDSCKSKSLH